jgi:hypothetical protein
MARRVGIFPHHGTRGFVVVADVAHELSLQIAAFGQAGDDEALSTARETKSAGPALAVAGGANTATGVEALYHNRNGQYNIAVGFQAGFNLTTGSHNIDIGNSTTGVAGESGVIRIGTQVPTALQTNAYIAGIYPNAIANSFPVVIDSTGHLGVGSISSERFKTAIAPMGSNSAKLGQLRPVSFHLKTDPKGALQYGLIAEEVAKVYPELVIRGEKGRIDGVRYDELAPMLLNDVQKQRTQIAEIIDAQAAEMRDLKRQVAELTDLNQTMQIALRKLQANDEFVAQR